MIPKTEKQNTLLSQETNNNMLLQNDRTARKRTTLDPESKGSKTRDR